MHNNIEIIVVLGNKSPVIFNTRASHAVKLFLSKISCNDVYLLTKFYENSWSHDTFKYKLKLFQDRILDDFISVHYRYLDVHDTINEALATIYVLENKYKSNTNDPLFNLCLTIVTTKCHEKRTKWIFSNIFKDVEWVTLNYDMAEITFEEINLNRYLVEDKIFKNQQYNITIEGGIYNFINNKNTNKKYTHYYFEKDNSKYFLKYNPF